MVKTRHTERTPQRSDCFSMVTTYNMKKVSMFRNLLRFAKMATFPSQTFVVHVGTCDASCGDVGLAQILTIAGL
jgi:hypothetical protein